MLFFLKGLSSDSWALAVLIVRLVFIDPSSSSPRRHPALLRLRARELCAVRDSARVPAALHAVGGRSGPPTNPASWHGRREAHSRSTRGPPAGVRNPRARVQSSGSRCLPPTALLRREAHRRLLVIELGSSGEHALLAKRRREEAPAALELDRESLDSAVPARRAGPGGLAFSATPFTATVSSTLAHVPPALTARTTAWRALHDKPPSKLSSAV